MYIPEFFKLYELLPEDFYSRNKKSGLRLWSLFDDRILMTIDNLRKKYGPMNVNTWYHGGHSQYRGWRPFTTLVGAKYSQHKFGRAVDLIPRDIEAEKIREDIIANPTRETYKYITAIETNISWLHIDCRNTNGLLQFPRT